MLVEGRRIVCHASAHGLKHWVARIKLQHKAKNESALGLSNSDQLTLFEVF